MRERVLTTMVGVYVLAALIGHARERAGAIRCECADQCWCQRPGVSLFRWVAPFGHRG